MHPPLANLSAHWHACSGEIPPPLVFQKRGLPEETSIFHLVAAGPRSPSGPQMVLSSCVLQATSQPVDASVRMSQFQPQKSEVPFVQGLIGASVTLVDSPSDALSPGKLYLFGGRLVSTRRMVNDLWELDLSSMVWKRKSIPSSHSTSSKSNSQPQPRYFHSSDLWQGKLIIFGGMGYANSSRSGSSSATSKADELCVLDEIIAYDLATQTWDLTFATKSPSHSSGPSSSSTSDFAPVPRYAHLSSMTSSLLTIIGGQDMSNQYVESISVFDLKQRKWIAQKDFGKQCGSYRSLAVAARWGVKEGKSETWSTLASNSGYRASDKKGKGRAELNGNILDSNRLRAGSTASNFSNLTRISSSDMGTSQIASPSSWTTPSSSLAAPSPSMTSRRPSEMSTSTAASSTSNEYKDAALSHSFFGNNGSAQPSNSSYPNTPTSAQSKGHQQLPSLKEISPLPSSYEPSESDPLPIYIYSNFNFTNVNRQLGIVNLKRDEQQTRKLKANGKGKAKEVEGEETHDQETEAGGEEVLECHSDDPLGPPEISISDHSSQMDGAALPPGLRFPTGSVLGSYLLISGTYLANTSQTFSIWALHLPTLTWSRLEPGSTLSSGSWNRAVLWPTKNRLLILGHRDRSLVEDYNHRQTNWDHVVLVELEAWGIYQPPLQRFDDQAVELGLEKLASSSQGSMLADASGDPLGTTNLISFNPSKQPESPHGNELLVSDPLTSTPATLPLAPLALGGRGDMEILCSDGTKIGCDRAILRNRWKWFREHDDKYQRKAKREVRKLLKERNLAIDTSVDSTTVLGRDDSSSSSVTSPSSPIGDVPGKKRGSTMSDAIRALLEDDSDESEDNENKSSSKNSIQNKGNRSSFDPSRRPSTTSFLSQSTALSERSSSSYRPLRTPTTGFSSDPSTTTPSYQANSQDVSPLRTSHDPRFLPRQLILNEPSPIVLAFLQYLYSQTLCTPLQRHPASIAALLVLAAAYDMPDLGAWARHAAHVFLTKDLSLEQALAPIATPGTPTSSEATHSSNFFPSHGLSLEQKHRLAVLLTESAALCGCEPLQIRALRSSMLTSKWLQRSMSEAGRSRSGTTTSYGTERSIHESVGSSVVGDQMSPKKNEASPSIGSNRETPTPTAQSSVDYRSRSNSGMASPAGSTSSHVRRFSLTAGGQATSRGQPPTNALPPAPAMQDAYVGGSLSKNPAVLSREMDTTESGTEDSDSSLPPLNPSRKPSSGLSKAERMLGITGAEAQAAGLPGNRSLENKHPSQRRPSAATSTSSSMLSVRSGNSGGGRKRFSIFGRSNNSSSTVPTTNTSSTSHQSASTEASAEKSPASRLSGHFDEDPFKRRSSEINSHSKHGLAGDSIPARSTSTYLTSASSSGTLASHTDPGSNFEASRSQNSLNHHGVGAPDSIAGRKSLKSRPSNSSSVMSAAGVGSENVYLQSRQPPNGALDSRELSSLRSLGTL